MKYCFILGSNPSLSIAELSAFFWANNYINNNPDNLVISGEKALILDTDKIIDASQIINKLGGVIKIGEIISSSAAIKEKIILKEILEKIICQRSPDALLHKDRDPDSHAGRKFKFGLSNYSRYKINIKVLGMEIKKYLRGKNISCRWVISKEPVLSSVVVEQNKLFGDRGIEIIFLEDGGKLLIGKTLAVQPFKDLSYRDYGRPARDDFSGMLPPKLAQIMINLAEVKPEGIILDPFCGSGTILTEAMLMGIKNAIGSDVSKKAVEDTEKNIEWIKGKYQISNIKYQLFNISVLELSKFIKPNSVDAIVTEPYLGPQRGNVDIKEIKKELENLYSKSIIEFSKVLKDNGRVVMVWPVYHVSHITYHISPNLNGLRIINPISESLINNKNIKLTNRNTIIYGRPGQKVWREIVVLEKI